MTLDDRKTIANSDLFDDEQNLAWNAIEGTSKSQLDLNIHDLNDSERNSTVHLERNILPYSKGIQLVIDGAVPFEQKNDDSDFSDNKALMSYLADKYGVMSPKDIEEKYITHIDGKNIKAWVEYEKTCFNMKDMPNYSAEEYNKIVSVLNEDSEQAFGIYSDGLDYELVCKGSTDKLYGEYGINLFKSYLQELLTKGEKEHMRILSILGPELQKDIFSFIENMTETPEATKLVDFSNKSLGKNVVDENAAKAILSYIEKRDYELLFEHGKAFVYDPELQEKNEYDMPSLMYYCSDMDSVENDISEEYCTAFDSAWNKFKSLSSNSMDETFKPNNIDSITRLSSLSNGKINEFDAEVILDSLSSQGILVSSRDGNVYSILGSDKKHRLYEIVSLAKNNKFIDDVQMKSLEKILVDLDERIPTDYISIIKKQLKHIVENEPDCDFAVQGKYEKAINLLDELQRTDPLLVKEAAIKSDEIDFDSLEKSMRNSLKNNTQEGKLSFQNSMNEAQNKNEEEKIVTESVTFPCGFTLSDKMDRSEMEKEELEMYSRLKAEFDFADNETSTGLFDGTDHNDPSYNINFSIPVPIEAQYPQSKTNEWVSSIEKKLVSKYGAFVSWEGGERTETCFKTKEGARRFAFDNSLLASITRREYDALSQLKLHKAPGEGEGFYNFMDRNSLLTFGILKFNGFENKLLSEKTLDTSFYKSISIIPSDYRVSNLYRFALKDTDCLKKDFEEKIYSASKEDKISLDKKLADEFATLSINQEKVRELLRYGADPFSLEGRKCWLNAAADAELGDNLFWLLDNLGSSNIENLFKDKDFADKVYSIAKESVVNDRDSWTAKEDIGIDGLRHIAKLCGKDKELDTEKYYNQLLHDSGFQLYLIQGTVDFSDESDGFTQKDLDRMKNTGIKEDDAIKIAGNLGENIDNIGNALTPDGKEIARNDALLKLIDTCYIGTKDELLNNYNIPEYDCHGNSLFETVNKSIDSQQKVTDRFVEKLNNLVPSNNTDIEVVLKAAQNALLGFNKEEKNLISKSFIEMGAEKNNFGDILNNALKTRKHSKRDVEKVHRNISRASDGIESL